MAFPYKHILMVGATSGIGREMADRMILHGAKVTAVGRRQDRLEEFVDKHPKGTAFSHQFDIADVQKTPQFATSVMETSPDIDCVFLNAGVQGLYDFSKPEKVDLAKFNYEIHVNFTAFVALTHAFLPLLLAKTSPTSIVITGTHLSVVPAAVMAAYSASKAALNAFTLCIREQLRNTNVKIIELVPPPVQTELHDAPMGPEIGRKFGMPVDKFTDMAYEGLISGKDEIIVGDLGPPGFVGAPVYQEIVRKRRETFEELAKGMRRALESQQK